MTPLASLPPPIHYIVNEAPPVGNRCANFPRTAISGVDQPKEMPCHKRNGPFFIERRTTRGITIGLTEPHQIEYKGIQPSTSSQEIETYEVTRTTKLCGLNGKLPRNASVLPRTPVALRHRQMNQSALRTEASRIESAFTVHSTRSAHD